MTVLNDGTLTGRNTYRRIGFANPRRTIPLVEIRACGRLNILDGYRLDIRNEIAIKMPTAGRFGLQKFHRQAPRRLLAGCYHRLQLVLCNTEFALRDAVLLQAMDLALQSFLIFSNAIRGAQTPRNPKERRITILIRMHPYRQSNLRLDQRLMQ